MALGPVRKLGPGLYQPLAEINVTPMVDVMLVLLIVFMVTAPMLAAGMKVNLPEAAKSAGPMPQRDPVTITISKDGVIFVNADPMPKERLIEAVRARQGGQTEAPIRLRGDRDANYGDVVAVLDLLASQGLTKIAILTDSRPIDASRPEPEGAP